MKLKKHCNKEPISIPFGFGYVILCPVCKIFVSKKTQEEAEKEWEK